MKHLISALSVFSIARGSTDLLSSSLPADGYGIGEGLRFSTCMAQGCLLPVSFPSAGMEAIRHARTFTVGALNVSNNQLLTIGISLNGFAVALDRAVQVVS